MRSGVMHPPHRGRKERKRRMLEAKNLSFSYEKKSDPRKILADVTLSVKPGERVGILAPSGAGKTTLLKILGGYLFPDSGCVLVDGKPLPKRGHCPVQLIWQHPEKAINPRWRLRRVLEESGAIRGEDLMALGIERAWLDRFPRELSGGELQRFCVARALCSGAPYLILDEISTMLDGITQAQIWNALLEAAEARSLGLLAVTHNPALAQRIATRTVEL